VGNVHGNHTVSYYWRVITTRIDSRIGKNDLILPPLVSWWKNQPYSVSEAIRHFRVPGGMSLVIS